MAVAWWSWIPLEVIEYVRSAVYAPCAWKYDMRTASLHFGFRFVSLVHPLGELAHCHQWGEVEASFTVTSVNGRTSFTDWTFQGLTLRQLQHSTYSIITACIRLHRTLRYLDLSSLHKH